VKKKKIEAKANTVIDSAVLRFMVGINSVPGFMTRD